MKEERQRQCGRQAGSIPCIQMLAIWRSGDDGVRTNFDSGVSSNSQGLPVDRRQLRRYTMHSSLG
jgi:hypothetical protein